MKRTMKSREEIETCYRIHRDSKATTIEILLDIRELLMLLCTKDVRMRNLPYITRLRNRGLMVHEVLKEVK